MSLICQILTRDKWQIQKVTQCTGKLDVIIGLGLFACYVTRQLLGKGFGDFNGPFTMGFTSVIGRGLTFQCTFL